MLNTFANITKNATLKKRIFPSSVFFLMCGVIFYVAMKNGFTPVSIVSAIFFFSSAILLLFPRSGKKIFYLISILTAVVNYIILNILLIIFYYILFTPLALLIQIFSRKIMSRRMDSKKQSMWKDHHPVPNLKQYFKQY